MENLFEKGCLVQLSVSVWGASRKIHPSQVTGETATADWLSASKKLISPEALKPIKRVVNASRTYLDGISLPFPIHGMSFVSKESISGIDGQLTGFKENFQQAVDQFTGNYDDLRSTAASCLGQLFNELDYPVNIRDKFSFVWRFVVLDVPNGNTALLAPEVYEREKEKFIKTMEQAREMAIESLRSEFAGLIHRITERFTAGPDGKPKIFKNATVESFYEFFETFKERNVFRDAELSSLVDRARDILGGEAAGVIRSNDSLRDQIGRDMKSIESAVAESFERPRRKIVLN